MQYTSINININLYLNKPMAGPSFLRQTHASKLITFYGGTTPHTTPQQPEE